MWVQFRKGLKAQDYGTRKFVLVGLGVDNHFEWEESRTRHSAVPASCNSKLLMGAFCPAIAYSTVKDAS